MKKHYLFFLLMFSSLFATLQGQTNNSPTFTSTAITTVDENTAYSYIITSRDSDGDNQTISATTLPSWLTLTNTVTVSTFAGGSWGNTDGTGTAAKFKYPSGVAVDDSGNVYVADYNNNLIRKISPEGVVSTLAGNGYGFANGTGTAAKFMHPYGLAVDGSGTVYVAEYSGNRIRKISPEGVVSTFAGSTSGYADGTGTVAKFSGPKDVAVDGSGTVYVADSNNNLIRKISPQGVVSTFAGSLTPGSSDGTGAAAQFSKPYGVAVDGSGTLYVADTNNNLIRKISPAGVVSTLASQLNTPYGVAVDDSGTVYVADYNKHRIRKISPEGVVSTLAGNENGVSGRTDGEGTVARFKYPYGLAADSSGTVYVADSYNSSIRKVIQKTVLTGTPTSANVGSHSVVLEVSDGNGGTMQQSFSITVVDTTPPVFENSTPSASSVAQTSFTLNTDIDGAGTIYYVVVSDGATAPTASEVKAGTASGGASAITHGNAAVSTGGFTNDFNVAGLTANMAYDVYVVAQDDVSTPNLQAAVTKIDVTTTAQIVITEIMYNSPESGVDTAEFIEFYNAGSTPVNMVGYSIQSAVVYTFGNVTINAGDYYVLTTNLVSFTATYGSSADAQWTSGDLSNGGEVIELKNSLGNQVDYVNYDDSTPWPTGSTSGKPDGGGASIVLYDIGSDNNDGTNWRASINNLGITVNGIPITASPGVKNVIRPEVTSVTVPTANTYVTGQDLVFTVNFNKNITVNTTGGIPQLAITIGATVRQAVYQSGSGTGAIVFRYAILAGDLDTDGITVGTLAANGGTFQDSVSNDTNLTLNSVGATNGVQVDALAPVLNSSAPTDNATGVLLSQNIKLTFSENINKGTGNIIIYDASNDTAVETIAVTSSHVSISNHVVTINPTADLLKSKNYYIQIANTAFKDASSNYFAGILDKTTFSFATELKTTPTITFEDFTKTYGDTAVTLAATSNSTGSISYNIVTGGSGTATLSGTNNAKLIPGNVGTVKIKATQVTDANYLQTEKEITLTITKKPITITADAKSKVYGDSDPSLTYQITTGSLEAGDVLTGSLTRIAGEDVGTYEIGSTLANTNYDITFVSKDLTIVKKAITITADAKSKVYGDSDPSLTYQITTGSLETGDVLTGSLTRIAGEDVGTYEIGSTLANTNYDITFVSKDLTIVKKAITITADAKSKVYGDSDLSLTYQITTGSLETGDVLTGNLTRIAGENVGAYAIGSTLANTNYDITFVSKDLTIVKKPITITADAKNKVYGDSDPSLTYQITTGSLEAGDVLTGSLTRIAGENVGTYAIGSTLANTNYSITFVSKDLTITKKAITITADAKSKVYGDSDPSLTYQITAGILEAGDVLTGSLTRIAGENVGTYALGSTLANTNYSITFVSKDLTIVKKPITITADAKNKVYGDSDPSLTYQITTGSLEAGDVLTGNLTRIAGEDVGAYAIGSTLVNANYNITFVSKDLTITKKAITITADAKSKVYGATDPSLTYQITTGSLEAGDVLTGNLTRIAGEDVGAYAIGSTLVNANYNITFVSKDLTIVKKAITITADAKNKVYGDSDPSLTYQITAGILETGDVLTGSLTRIAGEDVGAYAIGSTLANANYNITFVSKDLTIVKKAITITADAKSKVYGDSDPSLTYQITTGSLEAGDVLTGNLTRIAGEDVGAYALGSTLANTNYSITFVSKDLTIVKKPITITADAKNKVYGDSDPSLTYQITTGSLEAGDVLTGNLTRIAGEDVGAYEIGSTLVNANYNITFVSKDLTITKKAITITADAKSKVYGDSDPSLTYQITAGSLETGDVLTGNLTRIAGEDVGAYAIGSTLVNANYNITFVSKDLTITKKAITITADAKSKVYGDSDPSLTYQITAGSLETGDVLTGSLTRIAGENVGTYEIGSTLANVNYSITFVSNNLTIAKATQTITFETLTHIQDVFDFTATSSSGLAITYTSSNTNVATILGNTVTVLSVGTTNITAQQAGDANYEAASDVVQVLTIIQFGEDQDILLSEAVQIYPNPATNFIRVDLDTLDKARIKIYSITGKQLLEVQNYNSKEILNISSLKSGMYLLKIESDTTSTMKKFIKR